MLTVRFITIASFRSNPTKAFTLIELLAVVSIGLVIMVASVPALGSLVGAGSVNKAATDFSTTLELARSYAMTHQTYVRVAIGDAPTGGSGTQGSTIVLVIFSADGTLTASSATDMGDPVKWPAINRPLVLKNFRVSDTLNIKSPSNPVTETDAVPSSSDIEDFQRSVPGSNATFTSFIQFRPDGFAGVNKDLPSRHIKIGMDLRDGRAGRNPFIVRLSGNTGSVLVLRKENGVREKDVL